MRGISRRFWFLVSALLTALLLAGGGLEAWLSHRDSLDAIERIQRSESRAAAIRIAEYLNTIERQIGDIANLSWTSGGLSKRDRQEEYHRLMALVPAVFELKSLDGAGRERLYVSRVEMDRIDSGVDYSGDAAFLRTKRSDISYGPAYFRDGAQPYTSLSVREGKGRVSAATVAELNLKFVSDVVQGISIDRAGKAYVIDGTNHLLAHPNHSLVLRKTDMTAFDHIKAAREALARDPNGPIPSSWATSPEGGEVLVSAVYIPTPDWIVFVEQPAKEVLAPVRAMLLRTTELIVAGLIVAAIASLLLARRLTQPILQVQRGATQIGAGDLNARIDVHTGDELESLAGEFNRMADKLQESYSGLERKIEARTLELAEAGSKMRQQARELERLNAELTERLVEVGLRKDEADRANAAKTRFLAAASHDLRQPMHAISLLVGILGERIQYPEVRHLVGKVETSVQAMENLFNSLLDISKLDSGAVKPNFTEFEIDCVLQLIELNYAPLAREKGIALKVVHSEAAVRSDAALLERILGNLVANAIRYTQHGRVLVGCRRRGEQLRMQVFDTGVGIAADHMYEIFEEFVQLANPERDRSKGLGLGLSIVKRSVELLDHVLVVKSTPGKGSMFAVELPLVHAFVEAAPAFLPPDGKRELLEGSFIVVVDDDRENRFATESLFAQWGCHVVSAASCDEALAKLQEHLRAPDLIVSDFRLRDRQTGLTTVKRIRAQTDAHVPAIIVTGDLYSADIESAARQSTVLHKPVSPGTLRKTANELLEVPFAPR